MKKLILAYCFCGLLLAENSTFWPYWQSDTCINFPEELVSHFVVPAHLMCPDNEPNCYEPSSRWDVGIAILNGPLKASKAYFKYIGKNELTAVMGGFNALSDLVLLCLKEGPSTREGTVFVLRLTRELLRASNGPDLKTTGSYADFSIIRTDHDISNSAKGLLKIPLLIEKNSDWGEFTRTDIWLMSSMPGIILSLAEHYARYYRRFTLRPLIGLTLTTLELVSFYSLCSKLIESAEESAEEAYKSTRYFIRILLHGLQYAYLLVDRERAGASKFQKFTYLVMLEHLLVSAMELAYYNLYLQPTR